MSVTGVFSGNSGAATVSLQNAAPKPERKGPPAPAYVFGNGDRRLATPSEMVEAIKLVTERVAAPKVKEQPASLEAAKADAARRAAGVPSDTERAARKARDERADNHAPTASLASRLSYKQEAPAPAPSTVSSAA